MHFCVIVVTDRKQDLAEVMQPFNEFECTGADDKYVIDVDVTSDMRNDYNVYMLSRLIDSDGKYHDPYDDEFYRPANEEELKKISGSGGFDGFLGSGFIDGIQYKTLTNDDARRAVVKYIPYGYKLCEVKATDIMTFREFLDDCYDIHKNKPDGDVKYSYYDIDGNGEVSKVTRRTNPNSKWDWWVVGGRYSGAFSHLNPINDPRNYERCPICHGTGYRTDKKAIEYRHSNPEFSCNKCGGTGRSLKFAADFVNEGNVITAGSLRELKDNLKRIRISERQAKIMETAQKTGLSYERIGNALINRKRAIQEYSSSSKKDIDGNILYFSGWCDQKGGEYADIIAINAADPFGVRFNDDYDSISEWINDAPYVISYSYLKDGEWIDRSGTDKEWQDKLEQMLDSLHDDMVITIVDCHV